MSNDRNTFVLQHIKAYSKEITETLGNFGANKAMDNKRAEKEKEIYNSGLDRKKYNAILGYKGPGAKRYKKVINKLMSVTHDKEVLEIGSQSWKGWIDFTKSPPVNLTCINISESELDKGVRRLDKLGLNCDVSFQVMDAHDLKFPDNNFDVVYGVAILHHLNLKTVIKEIHRVLKPEGIIVFAEPLSINPVGKIVRALTPKERTPDEKPFSLKELKLIDSYFKTEKYYFQLFYVPALVLSKIILKNEFSALTKISDRLDVFIEKNLPFLRYHFRRIVIYGIKK